MQVKDGKIVIVKWEGMDVPSCFVTADPRYFIADVLPSLMAVFLAELHPRERTASLWTKVGEQWFRWSVLSGSGLVECDTPSEDIQAAQGAAQVALNDWAALEANGEPFTVISQYDPRPLAAPDGTPPPDCAIYAARAVWEQLRALRARDLMAMAAQRLKCAPATKDRYYIAATLVANMGLFATPECVISVVNMSK